MSLKSTESSLPEKHLIAQTIDSHTRGGPGDFSDDPRVNVLMNEYTWGIANLDKEYIHNKPMVLIETAYYPYYDGDKIAASRVEAWEFLVGGGAAFMQLNGLYSTFNSGAAGTENSKLLSQLKILKNFMNSFDFFDMQPGHHLPGWWSSFRILLHVQLAKPGEQYAFYITSFKIWMLVLGTNGNGILL